MQLSSLLAAYFETRETSETYRYNFANRVAAFDSHSGGVVNEEAVSAFLRSLTCSPETAKSYRASVLALWRFAADLDRLPYPVMRRIWAPACPATVIECYTVDEARKIVAAASRLKGDYPGWIPKRLYWSAIVRLAWDSGLRRGDCWRFNRQHLRPDGTMRVVQHKTGGVVTVRLRPCE